MKKSFFSYFTFYILLFAFVIILYISIDSNFRRKIMNLSLGFFNNYYSLTIKNSLVKENNLKKAIKKLEQQIKISDFLTTKSKNSFIDNIYLNAYRVEQFINTEEEFKYFSKTIKKLIAKDPDIYNAILWEAKLMTINDFQNEEIIKKINQAIELSPANPEAYRFALDYSFRFNEKDLFNKYCLEYHSSLLGGKNEKEIVSLYGSSSFSRFSIQPLPEMGQKEFYTMDGIHLNKSMDYAFSLKKPRDLTGFNLLANFYPGTSINLIKIEITNVDNETKIIPLDNLYISTKNSFIDQYRIISVSKSDDEVKIKFDKKYTKITKITIKFNFSKMNLTNKADC